MTSKDCGSCRFDGTDSKVCTFCRFTGEDGPTQWAAKPAPPTQEVDMQQPQYGKSHVQSWQEALDSLPPLPDGNPKTRFGMAKPPISLIPGPALVLMAEAFADGARKYGPANWRIDPVTTSTYVNAAFRHILAYYDGETNASDSGCHHLAHAADCLAILMDAEAQGTLNDDRPPPGRTADLIAAKTKPLT